MPAQESAGERLGWLSVVGPVDVAGRVDPGDVAPAVARSAQRDHRARRWALLLVAGWLAQAGLRAWLSRTQTVPLATPDESAYLIAARVLAGGVPANFSYSTLYPAGYPLLITPVYWFTHDPAAVYRTSWPDAPAGWRVVAFDQAAGWVAWRK